MVKFLLKILIYSASVFVLYSAVMFLLFRGDPRYFLGLKNDEFIYADFQYKKIRQKNAETNIIIGDSNGACAADPIVLGPNWLNISVVGGEIFEGYLTLKYFLQKNRVDTLVLMYGADHMRGDLQWINRQTIPMRFPDTADISGLENLETRAGSIITDTSAVKMDIKHLASEQRQRRLRYSRWPFCYRATVLDGIFDGLMSGKDKKRSDLIINELTVNKGRIPITENDSSDVCFYNNVNQTFTPNFFCTAYLDSIISLVKKNGIKAYFIVEPLNESSMRLYKNSLYQSSLNAFFTNLSKNNPQLTISQQPEYLPNYWFGDRFLHINEKHCKQYTKQYIQAVIRKTGG